MNKDKLNEALSITRRYKCYSYYSTACPAIRAPSKTTEEAITNLVMST